MIKHIHTQLFRQKGKVQDQPERKIKRKPDIRRLHLYEKCDPRPDYKR